MVFLQACTEEVCVQGPQEERFRATEQGLSPRVVHRGGPIPRRSSDFLSQTGVLKSEDIGN